MEMNRKDGEMAAVEHELQKLKVRSKLSHQNL
jgi:hypothetical protein